MTRPKGFEKIYKSFIYVPASNGGDDYQFAINSDDYTWSLEPTRKERIWLSPPSHQFSRCVFVDFYWSIGEWNASSVVIGNGTNDSRLLKRGLIHHKHFESIEAFKTFLVIELTNFIESKQLLPNH